MLEEDKELFIRKIGKDVQDEEMEQGKTLMLISVIVGVVLLLLGLILALVISSAYLYIVMGVGALIIIVSTTVYYGHRKSWEKKSFQVIGYKELERVREKIRDNDITDDHNFEVLTQREKLIYYTYELNYLHVIEEHEETRDVPVKIKRKVEYRPKTFNVKTLELTYNDGTVKTITSDDDHFNELILDFTYKEPLKGWERFQRADLPNENKE